jgi:hypothetical protein
MNANLLAKLAARKNQYLEATADYSEESLDQLVVNQLGQDSINILADLCKLIDKQEKLAGITREYDTSPKYEYGTVNGMVYKFLSKFVYLRSELKPALGLTIPDTAYTAEQLADWGKLTKVSPLGNVTVQIVPNLESVALQVSTLKAYLDLPLVEPILTEAQWTIKAERAAITAETKIERIRLAQDQLEADKANGLPTFTV